MLTNWAGNVTFAAARTPRPASVAEIQRLVAGSAAVRALGTGHSFNRIADTAGDLVSLAELPRSMELDRSGRQARITGAWTYGELGRELGAGGLALANTGSLPHISVAGACATGTHGSGVANKCLAACVAAVTLVTSSGDLVTLRRGEDRFDGAVLALGRLGVVVESTLDLVPTFDVAQSVVENVADERVEQELAAILAAAYSVSVFTTWGPERTSQVWVKEVADARGWAGTPDWGGSPADGPRNPVHGMSPDNATAQLGEPGPWHERLPHFRLDFTPSSGDELQSEYLLPLEHASAAWRAVSAVRESVHPLLQVSEIRAVAADPMWLSLTGGAPSVAFHFTWNPDAAAVAPVLALLEERLAPFGARPHWGKVFTTPPDVLDGLYPRLPDFRRLVAELDPRAAFGNDTVDTWTGIR